MTRRNEWFREFFGEEYLKAYGLRNRKEARKEIQFIENALEMRPSGLYLDLCCGEGRHAIPLAENYRIVGLDLSPTLLGAAFRAASSAGVRILWVRADARLIPFREVFHGVYCWFTTFGYFSNPPEDREVLAEVARALRPGGTFLLEVMNHEFLEAHPSERKRIQGEGCYLVSEMVFRRETGVATTSKVIHYPDGLRKSFTLTTRIYPRDALREMISRVGLQWIGVLEDPYSPAERGSPPRALRILSRRPLP